ncbi:anthrone oxygenase family protein [Pseudonocardia xinjiangensis]|uniref:anthrone oxygenase family protein n=1 Tax=Pseudonocardia xinjiangensis TaxID=75289 RepID=UPI003D94D6A0
MNLLTLATLLVTGFISCAEFGSYAFVHPVLRRLPATERIIVEQGLLRTYGRVMPVGMTLCVVLGIAAAADGRGPALLSWSAAAAFAVAVASTVVVNVPINAATGRWDPAHPPADWERTRRRWESFQGVRSWLLLLGFVLSCAAATT